MSDFDLITDDFLNLKDEAYKKILNIEMIKEGELGGKNFSVSAFDYITYSIENTIRGDLRIFSMLIRNIRDKI